MYLVNDYIANPTHNIDIALVGVGGTGSFVLPELALLSKTLEQLGRKPLNVHVFDHDKVETHNVGRQKFFDADVGLYKAEVLTQRVNRAMGTNFHFYNKKFDSYAKGTFNIVITCVDKLAIRKKINKHLKTQIGRPTYHGTYYWIDAGNSRDYGQVILGSYIRNPKSTARSPHIIPDLPNIIALHPDIKEDKNEPSCSMRASLNQQSFMINKLTGVYVMEMLSSLLLDFNILQSQVYFSLNPINVKTNKL